jgi:hypothetical protein
LATTLLDSILSAHLSPNEWFDYFGTLTAKEFENTLDEVVASKKFHSNLYVGFARKLHEYGNFQEGLSEEYRLALILEAEVIMKVVIANINEEHRQDIITEWAASQDYAERFGYRSGSLYGTLEPRHVFKNEVPDLTNHSNCIQMHPSPVRSLVGRRLR